MLPPSETEENVVAFVQAVDYNARLTAAKAITRLALGFTRVGSALLVLSAWLIDHKLSDIE